LAKSKRTELLTAVNFKCPVAVRNALRKAARKHDLTPTDILIAALQRVPPILSAMPLRKV
jgi:hypothetical protein